MQPLVARLGLDAVLGSAGRRCRVRFPTLQAALAELAARHDAGHELAH
ncbi:hypothetical protein [Pelomonas sp. Root1217]|nr:hypothetical protein [Pelomonas sp. Root1217]